MKATGICCCCVAIAAILAGAATRTTTSTASGETPLPAPITKGTMSLEETLSGRRSVRAFSDRRLTSAEIAQLCWAGQGITDRVRGLRTSPSAGALYPIELFVITAGGVDHYQPASHTLRRHAGGDLRPALRRAALDQPVVADAPACLVMAADVAKTARKYGARAERFCLLEAGHVAQNILLQATALRLAGVPVGAFDDDAVARALRLPESLRALYLVPVGAAGR